MQWWGIIRDFDGAAPSTATKDSRAAPTVAVAASSVRMHEKGNENNKTGDELHGAA